MQRTKRDDLRDARLFVILVLAIVTLISGGFLAFNVDMPNGFLIVGRWVPALVAIAIVSKIKRPREWSRRFALRPGGWGKLVAGSAAAVGVLLAVYAASAALLVLLELGEPLPWSTLGGAAMWLVPMILLFSLSTFGEQSAWRGYLQQILQDWGFWRSATAIATIWVLFHVPLHGVMALQGTISWNVAVTSTLGVFPLGVFLSAAVARFGSVWPAVFAHALPLTALNLLADPKQLSIGASWILAIITAALLLAAAALMVPRRMRATGWA